MKNHPFIQFLARPTLMHYTMPVLIIYLIVGTVAQKYIGLYEATRIFFADPLLWLDIGVIHLPLPGFPILIAIIFISLVANLIFKSTWSWASAGIILTHMGAMLLILGGLFTALFSTEGYLDFREGETKSFYHDYHDREFVLLDNDNNIVTTIAFEEIVDGERIEFLDGAASIEILNSCRNCEIRERIKFLDDMRYHSMAAHMALFDKKLEINNEENMAGIVFNLKVNTETDTETTPAPTQTQKEIEDATLTNPEESVLWDDQTKAIISAPLPASAPENKKNTTDNLSQDNLDAAKRTFKNVDGIHLVLEDVPQLPEFSVNGATYRFALRKVVRQLPFTVQLVDFQKDVYPGTAMAKGYQSRIRIKDGDALWESVIRMNEPLRYKGYSFYQSSFLRGADGSEISVLAVVWNAGRTFPYISSIAMCIGLILHLFLRRRYQRQGGLKVGDKRVQSRDDDTEAQHA